MQALPAGQAEFLSRMATDPQNSFVRFAQLPELVRYMTWEFVAHQSRVVRVGLYRRSGPQGPLSFIDFGSAPAILHACKEARETGLKFYTPAFTIDTGPWWIGVIYINPKIDLLFIHFPEPRTIRGIATFRGFNLQFVTIAPRPYFLHPLELGSMGPYFGPWQAEYLYDAAAVSRQFRNWYGLRSEAEMTTAVSSTMVAGVVSGTVLGVPWKVLCFAGDGMCTDPLYLARRQIIRWSTSW